MNVATLQNHLHHSLADYMMGPPWINIAAPSSEHSDLLAIGLIYLFYVVVVMMGPPWINIAAPPR